MTRKILFHVVYATSEEEKFRAIELDNHGPAVRGWQSAKNPPYPQDLILRLNIPQALTQIQILAHQCLIPERIELWTSAEEEECDPGTILFDYIGYITLSNNKNTEFKSRELKSITVPPSGKVKHVKLVLHPNHTSPNNPTNQVSLVAVQLLGEGCESAYDDLAFEMYVDREVAEVIRRMEQRKIDAVRAERFTYAGKLKSAMLQLREVGEKLGRLEVGKLQAISAEDYVRANRKKEQIEMLRKESYAALSVEDLLEENGVVPKNDEGVDATDSNTTLSEDILPTVICCRSPASDTPHHQSPSSPLHFSNGGDTLPPPKPQVVIATPIRSGSLRRRDKSATRNSYEAYDERIIPAPKSSEPPKEQPSTVLKMNEREKKQASLPITVFGITLVEKFYSRQYPDKEEGLRVLEAILKNSTSSESPNKTARAAIFLLHRALRDKVFSVYSLAASVVTFFFCQYITGRVSTAEATRCVEKILPELLSKSGDSTPRVHNTAVHTILSMAHAEDIRKLNLIPVHLTRTLTTSTHPRLALSRLEMVEQLILSLGISNEKQSGMTCRVLSELGASGLHHPSEPVRKVAERVLIQVYKVNPRLVRKQLPPDDDITRRNLLYRQLMTEFDKIDVERGKLVRSGSVSNTQLPKVASAIKSSASSYAAASASPEAPSPPSTPREGRQCIFCLRTSVSFTEEGLNIHYWKYCPMLTRCIHCQEVVEVSALSNHLMEGCQLRRLYQMCPDCDQAVERESLERHRVTCNGAKRCPFCQKEVHQAEVESSWREHLCFESRNCGNHPRAKYAEGQTEE